MSYDGLNEPPITYAPNQGVARTHVGSGMGQPRRRCRPGAGPVSPHITDVEFMQRGHCSAL
jgi:hypothetical protein